MTKGLQRRRGAPNGSLRFGVRHMVICVVVVALAGFVLFQFHVIRKRLDDPISGILRRPLSSTASSATPAIAKSNTETKHDNVKQATSNPWQCTFREYPPRRHYRLGEKLPFLQDAEYIYGTLPVVLEGTRDLMPHEGKICVNQTLDEHTRPFSDGTNPSILGLERLPDTHVLNQEVQQDTLFLASICITDGQCSWKDTEEEKIKYQLSPLEKPNSKYTNLMILDTKLQTVKETTLLLELDAPWGRRSRQAKRDANNAFVREAKAFDDARLFLHKAQVWISYREGPGFGYEKQVLNPIHFSMDGNVLQAYVKASETTAFCCGRNMALVSDGKPNTPLQSLTWVDPVTMVDVNDGLGDNSAPKQQQRRLAAPKRESHFHGTNGFLILLPSTDEYLGIGHFHRPPDRRTSDYARHGHHYTHAFFTITAKPPHRLTRLSLEFVFAAKSKLAENKDVTDMIQFASGAELVGSDTDGRLLVLYGINDCEGASIYLEMKAVQDMLLPVQEGQQVVDLMKKLEQT